MIESASENPFAGCLKQAGDGFVLTLPDILGGSNASEVADVVLTARAHPLSIDAAAVERIDTPCIQVLLAAARLWREEGLEMTVTAQSEVFSENLATLGLSGADLEPGAVHNA